MSTIYISGPMRGYLRFNFDAFHDLAEQLESGGYDVIDPAQHDRDVYPDIEKWPGFAMGDVDACPEFDLHAALAWDLIQVAKADELVLLPGWEDSSGACHERYVAEVCGKPIWLAHKGRMIWSLEFDDVQQRVSAPHSGCDYCQSTGCDGNHYVRASVVDELQERVSASMVGAYETKDSGVRVDFASGMRRDTDAGKPRYDLIPVMPVRRLAELYARGAVKYGDRNWELADSPEEAARFRASAERHFMQWKAGDDDEDHAIATVWNIFAALVTEAKLEDFCYG